MGVTKLDDKTATRGRVNAQGLVRVNLTNQRAKLPAAFADGISVPAIMDVDVVCLNMCTWITAGFMKPFRLKYASALCPAAVHLHG